MQLGIYLAQCKFLKRKGLFHHIRPVLNKAFLLAEKTEAFADHLKLFGIARDIYRRQKDFEGLVLFIEANHKEKILVQNKLHNLNHYNRLLDRVQILSRLSAAEREKELKAIRKDELLQSVEQCLSVSANVLFLLVHHYLDRANGDYNKARQRMEGVINLYRQNAGLVDNQSAFTWYVFSILNCGLIASSQGDIHLARRYVADLDRLEAPGRDESVLVRQRAIQLRSVILCDALHEEPNFQEADTIAAIFQEIREYMEMRVIVELSYMMAKFYIGSGSYAKAKHWIGQSREKLEFQIRADLQLACRYFELMIFADQEDLDSIEKAAISTGRYARKTNQYGDFDQRLLDFFRDYPLIMTETDLKQAFTALNNTTLAASKRSTPIYHTVILEVVCAWTEARLKGGTIRKYLNAK